MTVAEPTTEILAELRDVAKAIGLMRPDCSIDMSWFESPLERVGRVFGDDVQRQALLDVLDAVLPAAPGVAPAGEHWYPLLGPLVGGAARQPNAFVTIEPKPGETFVGLTGSLSAASGGATPIAGSLSLRVPLLRATSTAVDVIAGSTAHPVTIEARVATNLSVAGGDPIGLGAVRTSFGLTTAGTSAHIVLEQLDLNDDTGIHPEVMLDPDDLGAEATKVVVALLKNRLEAAAADAGLPAAVILLAQHLPALLGLDPSVPDIDPVPFLDGPATLQAWFAQLTDGDAAAPVVTWLDHLADVMGVVAAPSGDGTDANPWTIAIPVTPGLELELWCTRARAGESATPVLRVGASLVGGTGASAVVEGRATLFEAPLSGTGATRVLPHADVRVRAPANPSAFLVGPNPGDPVRVRSLVGGFQWDGNEIVPTLELLDVDFEGVHHERIDLQNGQSIVNAGLALLQGRITAALGGSTRAAALAALVGIGDPAGTAGWPNASRADFGAFAADPLAEIARVHRTVLGDVAHPWSAMLAAIATVVGVPTNPNVVTGAGTPDDPWLVGITTSGAMSFQLAGWNMGAPGGNEELCIGLRLGADQGAWHAAASLELLSFDLPASGPAAIRFVGGVHVMVRISSLPDAFEAAGVAIRASSIRLGLDWTAGSAMTGGAVIQNVTVTADGTTVVVPALAFPPGPSAPANPLAGFGVNTADAQELARLLIGRAAIAWGGMAGHALAGLLGLHRELTGVPAAAPLLTDGGATPFTNPLAALRALLHSVLTAVDADGVPVAASWLTWLAALIGNALPSELGRLPDVTIGGAGTHADPWALPVAAGTDALLWLEPGPPGAWATAAAGALGAATSSRALVEALAQLAPSHAGVSEVLAGRSRAALAEGIEALITYLSSSDGVVPFTSQMPTAPGWTAGTAATVAHHRAPSDAGVIAQVLNQLNGWPHGAVLLIGPRFSNADEWSALLAAAGAGAPAHVDFRLPGLDPAGVDLTGLAVNGWYTADLRDDGGTDPAPIVAQIERLVEQIRSLHGGQPVAIIAHSTAAVAARVYAAGAAVGRVAGLVAITAPFLGASLTPVVDPTVADAVRAVERLVPGGVGDAQLDAALAHLVGAIEGFAPPPAGAAEPPAAVPYPVGSFAGSTDVSLGAVPGLAIGSQLSGDLVGLLRVRLAALATAAAGAAPSPTHVGIGWRTAFGAGPGAVMGESVSADAHLRVDIGRVRLAANAAAALEPARPATRAEVRVALSRRGGWLAGSPTSFAGLGAVPLDVRARRVELRMAIEPDGAGGVRLTPSATIVDGAARGVPVSGGISDPGFAAALGAAFRGASTPTPVPGGGFAAVFAALQALGVAVPDGSDGVGVSVDALNAIAVDAGAFLGPRLRAALASADGVLGLVGPTAGPWVADLAGGLRLSVTPDPWRVEVTCRRDVEGSSMLRIGGASVDLAAGITVPGFAPHAEVGVQAGRVKVRFEQPAGRLRVEAPPWTDGIDLLPAPAPAVLQAARDSVLPRIVLSSAVLAVLERLVGPGFLIGPIDALLADPGRFLSEGGGPGGPRLDAARINALLEGIGGAAGLPGPGLTLFNEITVIATGTDTDTDTDTIRIAITKPAAGALLPAVGLALTVDIDRERHVTPGGSVTVDVPLGGAAGAWSSVAIAVGVSEAGVSLVVTPQGGTPIHLLPRFGGFADLAGNAATLLPQLLDELDNRIPASAVKAAALDVAASLDLYDNAGGFAAHQGQLSALVQPGALAALAPNAPTAAARIVALLNGFGLPGAVTTDGNTVVWSSPEVEVRGGWGAGGPEVRMRANDLAPANSPVLISFTAGCTAGSLAFEIVAGIQPPAGLGIPFHPAVRARLDSGALEVAVLPLGAAQESDLSIELAPAAAVRPNPDALAKLIEAWLLPLAAELSVDAATPLLARPLWTGTTLADVLNGAGILTNTAAPFHLQDPLPSLDEIPGRLVQAFAGRPNGVDLPIGGDLRLSVDTFGDRLGIHIHGSLELDTGSLTARVLFGGTQSWNGGVDKGVSLFLFRVTGTGLTFDPGLHIVGLGLGFSGNEGAALIDTADVKVGAADLFFFADISTTAITGTGAGVELEGVGLPLSLLGGPGQGAGNPVASSLLSNAPGSGGDNRAVNPAVNTAIYYKAGALGVDLDGGQGPVWIPMHRSFGPMYIDQVGIDLRNGAGGPFVGVLVDGAVHVGPLLAQVDDLSVTIPLPHIHQPDRWMLDLRGLAVAFDQPPVSIAGGLVKYPGPPVEYDGMLHVQIANLGISAVGGYARPTDAAGGYTSLFVFAALSYPLGGPPWLFVTGLGGGFGYNRELHPPQEITEVPGFFLVAAIDDNALANNPMGALAQIGSRVPPKRGTLWLAAGLRFSTFVVVNTTAVAYVTLDRGFELGVLGVSRMALPDADAAVVSVELALKARFSTEEGLLSVQAQLTDNSWVLSRDCQLTGGFAFFMWFREAQFVLTLGGYHPSFQKPDRFPVVPRLGFRWRVDDNLLVKGEAYFALTNSCVMLGGRLEASFEAGPVRAWFIAYADVLISWDPFHYAVDIGISVGVDFTAKICFFGCVRIHVSASLGASLHLAGPPLHGSVGIEYWVLSLTIPFGSAPATREELTWNQFRDKYLIAGDPSGAATNARVASGLLPLDPPGAAAAAGTQGEPWKVGAEYTFVVETRLAAERWIDFLSATEHSHAEVGDLDLAPMGDRVVTTILRLGVAKADGGAVAIDTDRWLIGPVVTPVPEATWQYSDPVAAAARNVNAITGLTVIGLAEPRNRSALIPIATLVDDIPEEARPLPFAAASLRERVLQLQTAGFAAQVVADISAEADSKTMIGLAADLLDDRSKSTLAARAIAGLGAEAPAAFAVASIRRRSAPPLVTPLATGLTMEPVYRPEPTDIERPEVEALVLEEPRLRAVLRTRPAPVSVLPSAASTRVVNTAAARRAPRVAPPVMPTVAGARLHRIPDPQAPRPTEAAVAPRTIRTAEVGIAASARDHEALGAAAGAVLADGVVVPSGTTHVWDLPGDWGGATVTVANEPEDAAGRVTFLSRTGAVLAVRHTVGPVTVPDRTTTVVVTCLGRGAMPGPSGWVAASNVAQVGALTMLCQDASLKLSRPADTRRRGQRGTTAMVRASEVVAGRGTETSLPTRTQVVVVVLDLADQVAADDGDLAIAVTGATVGEPVQVDALRQRALLYDVSEVDEGATTITVAVMSGAGWQVAGTVGVGGRAVEWATRFSAGVPDDLVPDGPSTPDGSITVVVTPPAREEEDR